MSVVSADWASRFIRELAKGSSVAAACREAGVGRSTAYERRGYDPEFAEAWSNALVSSLQPALPAEEAVPAAVQPTRLYWHPVWGAHEDPSQIRFGRWGGLITSLPIGLDGVCPDCEWFVPEERRWAHENRRDERVPTCPRQRDDLIRPRARPVDDLDPANALW